MVFLLLPSKGRALGLAGPCCNYLLSVLRVGEQLLGCHLPIILPSTSFLESTKDSQEFLDTAAPHALSEDLISYSVGLELWDWRKGPRNLQTQSSNEADKVRSLMVVLFFSSKPKLGPQAGKCAAAPVFRSQLPNLWGCDWRDSAVSAEWEKSALPCFFGTEPGFCSLCTPGDVTHVFWTEYGALFQAHQTSSTGAWKPNTNTTNGTLNTVDQHIRGSRMLDWSSPARPKFSSRQHAHGLRDCDFFKAQGTYGFNDWGNNSAKQSKAWPGKPRPSSREVLCVFTIPGPKLDTYYVLTYGLNAVFPSAIT